MNKVMALLGAGIVVSLAGAGYLYTSNVSLVANQNKQNNRIVTLSADLQAARDQLNDMRSQIQESQRVLQTQQSLSDELERVKLELEQAMASDTVSVSDDEDSVTVTILNGFLFTPGDAHITAQGEEFLVSLFDSLNSFDGNLIRVIGHTDDLPISEELSSTYQSNWELGAQRAINVVKFLKQRGGVLASKLEAGSAAQYRPIADNATQEGKSQNRRIEIQLIKGN